MFREQAKAAARCLLKFKLHNFDAVYTSLLDRSVNTFDIIKNEFDEEQLRSVECIGYKNPPIKQTWRLNERHYGALIGLTKDEAVKKYGRDAVRAWRLSWDARPPDMTRHAFYFNTFPPDFTNNLAAHDWQSVIWTQALTRVKSTDPSRPADDLVTVEQGVNIPLAESVQDTAGRVLPLWETDIVPRLLESQTVLVVAHSNTIRGMVKHIDADTLSDENLKQVTIPSAVPLIYSFEPNGKGGIRPTGRVSPLGVRGRFVVTPELLVLSLAASQHMEMSENLDNTTAFKDVLRKTLLTVTSQTRVQQLRRGSAPDCLDADNELEGHEDGHTHEHGEEEELAELRRIFKTADGGVVDRAAAGGLMKPGWMSLPINDDRPQCDRTD